MSSIATKLKSDRLETGVDSVSAYDPQFTNITSFAVLAAGGTVFTLGANEIGVIANQNNATLLVKLGTGASAASYNYILKAGAAAADGNGGVLAITNYVGPVSVFSGGTYSFTAWKQN